MGMTDLRARLADAFVKELRDNPAMFFNWTDHGDRLADVLLSLPGIAITELPQPDSTRYEGDEHEPMDRLAWVAGGWSASVWQYPEVQISGRCRDGFWQTFEPIPISDARGFAAALLAAANTADEQPS